MTMNNIITKKSNNVAVHFLEKHLKNLPNKIAYIYEEDYVTFKQVYENVNKMAALLKDLGIRKKNKVCIFIPDSMDFIYTFWGSIWIGSVPIPINILCTEKDINNILNDSQADLIITSKEYVNKIPSSTIKVFIVDDKESLTNKLSKIRGSISPEPCNEKDIAFCLYTSGSTSEPKGVIHKHESMIISATSYAEKTIELNRRDIIYSAVQMPFAYGLGNSLYMPLFVGATSIISSSSNVFDIISEVNKYKPTVFFGIPSIYSHILSVNHIQKFCPSNIRLFLSAGEQLPKVIWDDWFRTFNAEIYEGIGSTEMLHIYICNKKGACKPGSSGRPIYGYVATLYDDNGEKVKQEEVGELYIQGDSMMKEYSNYSIEYEEGKGYRTGDKYSIDSDGFYHYIGRSDNTFKINGKWIMPSEIENCILSHTDISDVVVCPERDKRTGTITIKCYYCTYKNIIDTKKLEREIKVLIRSKLSSDKVPKHLQKINKIPRNQNGKVNRKLLNEY
ncbi:AMP-binding protein [Priestia megaterium]|uniref:AMP-binding protein n=1 Tax=Priestia megaterium TaxID=1404 RepID=UPI002E1CB82C|nr:AMP-binding protein [Priestia megaterium]